MYQIITKMIIVVVYGGLIWYDFYMALVGYKEGDMVDCSFNIALGLMFLVLFNKEYNRE